MNFRKLAIGAFLLTTFTCAHAAPVFSETPTISTGTHSDAASTIRVADDFVLSSTNTIRSVDWRGMYYSSGTPQAVDAFKINFYANASGNVGALLASFNVGNAVNRTATGQFFGGNVGFFNYDADLGAGITLGAGTYWMSIFNDTSVDSNDDWYWATNTSFGNNKVSFDSGSSWSSNNMTSYFILDNANINASSVPEPASLVLLGLGLAGLGLSRRKKA